MRHDQDPATGGRAIIDANSYMVLATADADGRPWASPVWFAPDGYTEFLWVSEPGARHSANLTARPELGIVVFDSHVEPGQGKAVYMEATAATVPEAEIDDAIATFSRHSEASSLSPWARGDVEGEAKHRLYRARASQQFVLNERDERIPVDLSQLGRGG